MAGDRPADNGLDGSSLAAGAHTRAVTWHGDVEELFPGRVWTVRGAFKMLGFNFPATATLVRDEATQDLVIFNALRFDDAMNAKILALVPPGARLHVVRLGAYHGGADSYWQQVQKARLWAMDGHKLQEGITADETLSSDNHPLSGDSSLFEFNIPSKPEAVMVVRGSGVGKGIAVFCDAVLNINSFEYCGIFFRPALYFLGFLNSVHCPDPYWLDWICGSKGVTSKGSLQGEFERLIEEESFDSYVSGHGPAELGDAHSKIRESVRAVFAKLR